MEEKFTYSLIENVDEDKLETYSAPGETWRHILSSPYQVSSNGRIYDKYEKRIYMGITLEQYFKVKHMEEMND